MIAELRGTDLYTDLAVLEVDATHVNTFIELGNSELTKVGEPVIAIGNPLGLGLSGSVTDYSRVGIHWSNDTCIFRDRSLFLN